MRKIRVYVDTSVFGGTQDNEFEKESLLFFEKVAKGEYLVLLSTETLREIRKAPNAVQAIWKKLSDDMVEILTNNAETEELSLKYIEANVLGLASRSDALHVAAATLAGADLVLSWNFKHIVNFNRIRGFNSVNMSLGLRVMTILSPMEVVGYETRKEL